MALQDSDSDSDIKKFNFSTNYNQCKIIIYLSKIVPNMSRDSVDSFGYIRWSHRTSRTLGKHSQTKLKLASKWEGKYKFLEILWFWIFVLNFQSSLFLQWNWFEIIFILPKLLPKCFLDCVDTFRYIHGLHRTSRTLEKHSQTKLNSRPCGRGNINFQGSCDFG